MAGRHRTIRCGIAAALLLVPLVAQADFNAIPAASQCLQAKGGDWSSALPCYTEAVRKLPLSYDKLDEQAIGSIHVLRYRLHSQDWSPENATAPASWFHTVSIFIPRGVPYRTALLVIDGGTRLPEPGGKPPRGGNWDTATLAHVAESTQSIVVHLSDVPNQYLQWADGVYRTEDSSVAQSWMLALRGGPQAPFASLHVPMAAAAVRAMDLAERELVPLRVNRFIVTGLSKRGWATWLAALADDRVVAIAPAVIEVPDTASMIERTRKNYGGHWPVAFRDYASAGVLRQRHSPAFASLMKLEDPLAYLDTSWGRQRLSIPKYIISASGDDFFLPDNVGQFVSRLPGPAFVRAIPQADHALGGQRVPELIVPFVNRLQRNRPLPHLSYSPGQTGYPHGQIIFSETPTKTVQWSATNPQARDFRYACGLRYVPTTLPSLPSDQTISSTHAGWKATFVEAWFGDGLSLTSPVQISPDTSYPETPPPTGSPACSTLPDD